MIAASLALLAAKDRISPRRHGDTEKSEINEQQIQNFDHRGHRGHRGFFGKIKKPLSRELTRIGKSKPKIQPRRTRRKRWGKTKQQPLPQRAQRTQRFFRKSKNL